MPHFTIRNANSKDAEKIEKFGFVLKMLYLYHQDLEHLNMFFAVDGDDEVLAVAHLMPHDTFHAVGREQEQDFVYHLTYEITFAEGAESTQVKDALTQALIGRCREIKALNPHKRIAMSQYMDADSLEELGYYLARGFCIYDTIVVFKFDLSRELPNHPLPEGVQVVPFPLQSRAAQEQYHQAELAAFNGVAWSLNHLGWMEGSPEMKHFCAFYEDRLIGSTSTWRITEERSATENVFVVPEWQKQGIALNLLRAALNDLKNQGKMVATLGTYGTNCKAIRLYTRFGYELIGFRFNIGYEIE